MTLWTIVRQFTLRRGGIDMYHSDDMAWTLHRLNDRVSFRGWSFAVISGLSLWTLMFRLLT
jgi:hypothetical protein